ncbi:MAG: RNA methyltransferase [Chloroflexia bacterium]|nr:RNA methyltransferase [Chloroflexia bacterium]
MSRRRYYRLLATLARRQPDLAVLLENLHDPYNVSAVLRTCDAVGVGAVHLLYTQEEPPELSRKVSSSAHKWLDLHWQPSPEQAYAALRQAGLRIYATGLREDALPPHQVDWTQPCALVLGNENRGLSEAALAQADAVIYIPMRGMVQSVNVSVAAAMLLYEAQRQRQEAGFYDRPRLPEPAWRALLERWLERERQRK